MYPARDVSANSMICLTTLPEMNLNFYYSDNNSLLIAITDIHNDEHISNFSRILRKMEKWGWEEQVAESSLSPIYPGTVSEKF